MGNQNSKSTKGIASSNNIINALDQLASQYILTQNFHDMENLADPNYCNKLVILTADIVNKFLKDREVIYLAKKINGDNQLTKQNLLYLDTQNIGYKKSENFDKNVNTIENENLLYNVGTKKYMAQKKPASASSSVLKQLDVKDPTNKKRMCIGIAKFYIKIAHLFSAVLKTVNPLYQYKDSNGKIHTLSIMNKNKIPAGSNIKIIKKNFCDRRLNALGFSQNTATGDIKINLSKVCNLNKKEQTTTFDPTKIISGQSQWGETNVKTASLGEEIGIPELEKLYYDKYDYETGKYTGMSTKSRKEYNKDLKEFYIAFMDKNSSYKKWNPNNKKKFGDIALNAFHDSELCTSKDAIWKKTYTGKNTGLFSKYAEMLKNMEKNTLQNQEQIIKILDKIFVWEEIPGKNNVMEKKITLHPKLDLKELDKIILEARKLILSLYFKCENNFKESLYIFEAIIKNRRLKTAISRNETLGDKFNKILGENETIKTALKSVETNSEPEIIKNNIENIETNIENKKIAFSDKIEQELIPKNIPTL